MTVPTDPMLPGADEGTAETSPLRAVTITTGDMVETRRFYAGALGMVATVATVESAAAAELAAHWGLEPQGDLEFTFFTQPFTPPGGAVVRALRIPAGCTPARPDFDSKYIGPLGFGFPIDDLHIRARIAEAVGYRSSAGVKEMDFSRADGTTYSVGEIHLLAPDDILVLGVDRGDLRPVGPIDPALRIGQVGYASVLVEDIDKFGVFLQEVLGLVPRRKTSFDGAGKEGGMIGLDLGEKVAFEQWFSSGSSTGYLVVMQRLERERLVPPANGFAARGVAMWTFMTTALDAAVERYRASGGTARIATVTSPGFGSSRSAVLRTPDGLPVELIEKREQE